MLEQIQNRHRSVAGSRIYEDPFPLNVFRHRLRTRLHRHGNLDLEIVDTVMGHRDGATLTHGSFSMRVWREDAEAIRPALTAIFSDICFAPPPLWRESRELADPGPRLIRYPSASPSSARADRLATSLSTAQAQIHGYIKGELHKGHVHGVGSAGLAEGDPGLRDALMADVCLLSEEQLDELSLRLLRDEAGMPSVQGALRYEALIELAGDAWTHLGKRARIRKRYPARTYESSPFTPLAPQAAAAVPVLRAALENLFEGVPMKSGLRLSQALALAVYDLLLVSWIANLDLLNSVIADDARWRVVRLKDEFYLEWSPSEDLRTQPWAPIQRYAISRRSAWLLRHAIQGKARRAVAWKEAHPWTTQLAGAVRSTLPCEDGSSSDGLLRHVARLVDQRNSTELPGTVAAYLGGRLTCPSLPWGDWVQLCCGRWVLPPHATEGPHKVEEQPGAQSAHTRLVHLPEDSDDEVDVTPETLFVPTTGQTPRAVASRCARSDAAYKLFARLRGHLNHLQADQRGARHRALAAEAMAKDIVSLRTETSSAIQLLGLWAIDLLLRPGRSRKLAITSVLRYFGALSPRFQAIGYEVELHVFEDHEIEDLYGEVLSGATVKDLKELHDGLRNFHRFAMTAASLPEVDWSILGSVDSVRLGSPGWIDDRSYLELLDRLGRDRDCGGVQPWQLQVIAILARRFGLRGAEATGLRRSDMQWGAGIESVIVRRNRQRDLKTHASRRVVPLVYKLADIEEQALRTLAEFHAISGLDLDDAPLFGVDNRPCEPIDGLKARARINDHLKALTGQPASSLHKLRKAFVIDLWAAIEAPRSAPKSLSTSDPLVRQRIAGTLLAGRSEQVTRRGAWAVARAAGHAGPRTTLRSYAHILSDVAAAHVQAQEVRASWSLKPPEIAVIRLDTDLPGFEAKVLPAEGEAGTPTPLAALRALLHLAHGRSSSAAALSTGLPFHVVESLEATAMGIYLKLSAAENGRLTVRRGTQRESRRLAKQGLLSLVHVNAFSRLRKGFNDMSVAAIDALRSVPAVPPAEWNAIIGARREVSMWKREHFRLAAAAGRHFVDRSRLVIEMPTLQEEGPASRIRALAIEAGWVPDSSAARPDPAILCNSIGTSSRLPRVKLARAGITIDARAVMRVTGTSAADHVCDGIEMALALVCLNACATALGADLDS